jgi:hypothetical protein
MPRLTESELRFEIRRALQGLPRSVLRDMLGKPDAHERGLSAAVEVLYARFAPLDVLAPEPQAGMDFGAMKNRD